MVDFVHYVHAGEASENFVHFMNEDDEGVVREAAIDQVACNASPQMVGNEERGQKMDNNNLTSGGIMWYSGA